MEPVAVAAPDEAEDDEDEAADDGGRRRLIVEVRHWAVAPGKRVMETTELVRGLTGAESWRLRRAVEAGRFTEAPDGSLAEVAWRDFECGSPPAWLVEQDRKMGR